MLCCIAAGTVIAFGYRVWSWVARSSRAEISSFAPPARWTGTGTLTNDARPKPMSATRRLPRLAPCILLAVATYPVAVGVLALTGLFVAAGGTWVGRLSVGVVAGIALMLTSARETRMVSVRQSVFYGRGGLGLIAHGTVWTGLMTVEFHVFETLQAAFTPRHHGNHVGHSTHGLELLDMGIPLVGGLLVVTGAAVLALSKRQAGNGSRSRNAEAGYVRA